MTATKSKKHPVSQTSTFHKTRPFNIGSCKIPLLQELTRSLKEEDQKQFALLHDWNSKFN